jgi:hypothetical protein
MSRVFNVSHHKCGTTSVHRALEFLGFKSYHWFNPDGLLKAHMEGRVASEPMLQEDNTAWNDLPITLMYRALYEAFPKETFIFIRRDPASWIDSLRRHMKLWPEPLVVHTWVYGYPMKASNFDPRVCLRVYDRICQDIIEFFHGKSNFHLIEFGDLSWKTLCQAVGKPEPSVPFPWENRECRA